MIVIGRRLRQLRMKAGMTQAQVAAKCDMERPIYTRLERGIHTPSLETLARVAGALDVRLVDIVVVMDTHPDWDVENGRWVR